MGKTLISGGTAFASKFDLDIQECLTRSMVEWRILERDAQFDVEIAWRSVFGRAFIWHPRQRQRAKIRAGSKADFEYSNQFCDLYLIIPLTSDLLGNPMPRLFLAKSAYECHGHLVPLGQFCYADFFVSPPDFAWTMVHTHEDHGLEGPYFVLREWLS